LVLLPSPAGGRCGWFSGPGGGSDMKMRNGECRMRNVVQEFVFYPYDSSEVGWAVPTGGRDSHHRASGGHSPPYLTGNLTPETKTL
jgi:hypothetical protein